MTLTSQYIKFITDTQRRLEEDEVSVHTAAEGLRQHPHQLIKAFRNVGAPKLGFCHREASSLDVAQW